MCMIFEIIQRMKAECKISMEAYVRTMVKIELYVYCNSCNCY